MASLDAQHATGGEAIGSRSVTREDKPGDQVREGHAESIGAYSEDVRPGNGSSRDRASGPAPKPVNTDTEFIDRLLELARNLQGASAEGLLKALVVGAQTVVGAAHGAILLIDGDRYRLADPDDAPGLEQNLELVFPPGAEQVRQCGPAVLAPLFCGQRIVGALHLSRGANGAWAEGEHKLLDLLVRLVSPSINRALLVATAKAASSKDVEEGLDEIIGTSPSLKRVLRLLRKAAASDVSVLVTGETGTGKELVARAIHRLSERHSGPFLTVNCAAIPENLLESEMFGCVKTAFTGAGDRAGKFQEADGGTLFLDEVGELSAALQAKLLTAIQSHEVCRLGSSKRERCNIRVVAATNRNLEWMVRTGEFREDLYYRLDLVRLHLPPLRERGEDVLTIATALLPKCARETKCPVRPFSSAAVEAIRRYGWPGNVRQLENRIKRALVLCEAEELGPEDLALGLESQRRDGPATASIEQIVEQFFLQRPDIHPIDFAISSLSAADRTPRETTEAQERKLLDLAIRAFRASGTHGDTRQDLGAPASDNVIAAEDVKESSRSLDAAFRRLAEKVAETLVSLTRPIKESDLSDPLDVGIRGIRNAGKTAGRLLTTEAAARFKSSVLRAALARSDEIDAVIAGNEPGKAKALARLLKSCMSTWRTA